MTTTPGYSRAQIWLHWMTLAAAFAAWLGHDAMKDAWRAAERGGSAATPVLHIAGGLLVLALVVPRLALRFTRPAPPHPPGDPAPVALAARVSHWALYALMILLPASGASAWFLGLAPAAEAHESLFAIALTLVALHAAAALWHHFVRKDGVLARMWRSGPPAGDQGTKIHP